MSIPDPGTPQWPPIVDDQPLIRRALAMTFRAEPGVPAGWAGTDLRPDMIVRDLQIPRADGAVAARETSARQAEVGWLSRPPAATAISSSRRFAPWCAPGF